MTETMKDAKISQIPNGYPSQLSEQVPENNQKMKK